MAAEAANRPSIVVHEPPPKTIRTAEGEKELRVLSEGEKSVARGIKNLIFLAVGLIVLVATLYILLNYAGVVIMLD